MTGILPITRYSSGSEFNMFFEFSMATMAKYSEYFDFTDEEVDVLHQKYIECQTEPKVTRAGRNSGMTAIRPHLAGACIIPILWWGHCHLTRYELLS